MARVGRTGPRTVLLLLLATFVSADDSASSVVSTDSTEPTTVSSTSELTSQTTSFSPTTTVPPTTTEAPLTCPDVGPVRKNNWPETNIELITSQNATGVTSVSWAPYVYTNDTIDASQYVEVTYNSTAQAIEFTALPTLSGVRDYDQKGYPTLAQLTGTCQMRCGGDIGEFQFILLVQDRNTASPKFGGDFPRSVDVSETFPTGIVVPDLIISASDADADATNYALTFTIKEDSPFRLTEPVKTGDVLATYTTQLKLAATLDYSKNTMYQLTVTAKDPGGKSADVTITVNVKDEDTEQPKFDKDIYTVTVDEPETPGQLGVSISATDPDAPGNLTYTLITDSSGGNYMDYFSLDPATAELNLTQSISAMLQPYDTAVTFTIEAQEDGGYHFTCRSALVIKLPALTTTTTAPPTSTTPVTSTEASSSPTTAATETTSDGTTPTPVTSSSTEPTGTTAQTTPEPTGTTAQTTPEPTGTTAQTTPEPTGTTAQTTSEGTTPTPVTSQTSTDTPVTSPTSTDTTAVTSADTTVTSPGTSPTTVPTSAAPSSTPTPTPSPSPSPSPVVCPLFVQRQWFANSSEGFTGEVTTVAAVPEAGAVTYFLRTPGYEDSFALDESTGTLSKKAKLGYQQVSLLVQAIPAGGSAKDQTDRTDIVDWDETLIIVDIMDENDCSPVLDCSAYADSCDSVVVGFPASTTASLPAPLLQLTVTDGDRGDFGVAGVRYRVDSDALDVDSSGMLYLVKQQTSAIRATVTALDNNGQDQSNRDTATIQLVPVTDDQVFFVRTESQLTDVGSVTSLLEQIAQSGSYRAVFSWDFQALSAADKAPSTRRLSDDDEDGSAIYFYALREDSGGAVVAVDSDDIKESLDTVDSVEYVETKKDQMSGGGSGGDPEGDNTGLIVAVAVLACLLVVVIIGAVLRQRQLLRRPAGSYARQKNDAESYAGGMVNSNYSPEATGRRSESNTYSNRAFQSGPQETDSRVFQSGPQPAVHGLGSEPASESAPRQERRPSSPGEHPLIDLSETQQPTPEEPTPDYSLKSVGFKETVLCVSPVAEEDGEDAEDGEDGEDAAGEDGPAAEPEPDAQTAADSRLSADGEHDENSML
ncbi:mucin-17-like isoform X1 [Amphibalanus amphitrite]|uniref:mucin-17-like isoform X1 n=1 Tax=Amphibalanus amphitrite TaxID=1232801 RepID=UPI001C900729|nr:mucin-17-like isoform X1 [Amphibalanus amphitrite]